MINCTKFANAILNQLASVVQGGLHIIIRSIRSVICWIHAEQVRRQVHVDATRLDDIATILANGTDEEAHFKHNVIPSNRLLLFPNRRYVVGRERENREVDG